MRWLRGISLGVALALATATGALAQAAAPAAEAQGWSGKATLSEAADPKAKPQTSEGTVEWTTGADAQGKPTLIGSAKFPDQKLEMDLVIATNPDEKVQASHLFDVRFVLGEGFAGQSVTAVPGIALRNDLKGQGMPLVGASVPAGDNSFLFALSADKADLSRNMALLGGRDFLDVGAVFGNGHHAVLTLELGGARAAFADFAAKALQ